MTAGIMAPWLRIGTPFAKASTSANRIALVWALRGTIATALPLLILPIFGVGLAGFGSGASSYRPQDDLAP